MADEEDRPAPSGDLFYLPQALFLKGGINDRQHLINTTLEMKKIDAETQANTLTMLKEMTNKTLG